MEVANSLIGMISFSSISFISCYILSAVSSNLFLQVTKDGFEKQLGVNHLGHFSLTAQLLSAGLLSRGEDGKEAARFLYALCYIVV